MQPNAAPAPRPATRDALYFPPDAHPTLDLSSTRLTPHARLTLLSFWRRSSPFEDHVDAALVRRETGLDPLSFDSAVAELRRAGLVMSAADRRYAAVEARRNHLDLVL